MAKLIIAEKPIACKKIVEALADTFVKKKFRSVEFYEFNRGNEIFYAVPAVGHLFNLIHSKKVKPFFEVRWAPSYLINKESMFTKKYVDAFRRFKGRVDGFIVSTDFDVEGSVIGFNILKEIFEVRDGERMKFSSLTRDELRESFDNRSKHLDIGMVNAGLLRHYIDYFWGINTSSALMESVKKAGRFKILSVGRVQGPTLRILAEREMEIKEFKPVPFFEVLLAFKGLELIYGERFFNRGKAEEVFNAVKDKAGQVVDVEKSNIEVKPPVPMNLTSLQTECYKNFGLAPIKTLELAQSLYENGLISYPRTSSEQFSDRINFKDIMSRLGKFKAYSNFIKALPAVLTPTKGSKVDSAHPPIHPTGEKSNKLSANAGKVYDLIVRRFIANFSESCVKERTSVTLLFSRFKFMLNGRKTVRPGWLDVYGKYSNYKDFLIPDFKVGDSVKPDKVEILDKETQPPPRYSQASIIKRMDDLNIGTKATRAGILRTLYEREYIVDNSIIVTELGRGIIDVLRKYCGEIISVELTRGLEDEMELVEGKKVKMEDVLEGSKKIIIRILNEIKLNEGKIGGELLKSLQDDSVIGVCSKCSSGLRVLRSRSSGKRFVGCQGYPNCNVSFPLPQFGILKNARKQCKVCSSPIMILVRKGKRPWSFCINPKCESKKSVTSSL